MSSILDEFDIKLNLTNIIPSNLITQADYQQIIIPLINQYINLYKEIVAYATNELTELTRTGSGLDTQFNAATFNITKYLNPNKLESETSLTKSKSNNPADSNNPNNLIQLFS